jgi:hypothetical protein
MEGSTMAQSKPARPKPNSDQLRDRIDRGKGGDKVPYADPAAAPLGTDDEAAGTSPSANDVERAMHAEIGRRSAHQAKGDEANSAIANRAELMPLLIGVALFAVCAVLAWWLS